MRRRSLSALFISLFFLFSCSGTSQAEQEVALATQLIERIGAVGYASLPAINRAEHAYRSLSDGQKADVANAQALAKARTAYNALANVPARGRLDRTRFHFGTYVYRETLWNDADMQKLTDAGIDLIAGAPYNQTLLDLCQKHGVGVFLSYLPYPVTATAEQYDEAFAAYSDHPAVWAMDIVDEPHSDALPQIGERTKQAEALFPAGLSYINLFPIYASSAQLGNQTYKEHVDAYVKHVDTDYISYDHYMYANPVSRFLANLQVVSDACRTTGRDLWIVLEVSNTKQLLNDRQMRVQAYASLCYGAKLINWACWTAGWFTPDLQIVDSNGNYTSMYDDLKAVNREILQFSDEYMQFQNIAAFPFGDIRNQFLSTAALSTLDWEGQSVFTSFSMDQNGSAVIGYFEKNDGSEYALMVTNATDIQGGEGENTFSFRVPFAVSVSATKNGKKTVLSPDEQGVYSVVIPNGGGTFITAARDEAAAFREEAGAIQAESAAPFRPDVSSVGFGALTADASGNAAGLAALGAEFAVGQAGNGAEKALAKKGIGLFATNFYQRGVTGRTWGAAASSSLSYAAYERLAAHLENTGSAGLAISSNELSDIPNLVQKAPGGFYAMYAPLIKRSYQSQSIDFKYLSSLAHAGKLSADGGKSFWLMLDTAEIPALSIGAPNKEQLTWQIWSAFAFGAKKVVFSSYEALAADEALLAAAQKAISEMKALAPVYGAYTYQGFYSAGVSVRLPKAAGVPSDPLAAVSAVRALSADGMLLCGLFSKGNGSALLLLPGDTSGLLAGDLQPVTVTLTLDGSAQKVLSYSGGKAAALTGENGVYTVTLTGPEGLFITIE